MKKIKIRFQEWDCIVRTGLYENSRLAITLEDANDGDLVATATTNIPERALEENSVFIKEYSENEGMFEVLHKAGIITNIVTGSSNQGFAIIKSYRLAPLGEELLQEAYKAFIDGDNE